jgi:hypothetical protein
MAIMFRVSIHGDFLKANPVIALILRPALRRINFNVVEIHSVDTTD